MSNGVQVTILCEDLQTRCVIRQFLMKSGYTRHELHEVSVPGNSGGAGDKWVRDRFPVELKAYHNRKHRASTCLIVALDADLKETVDSRRQWLRDACDEQKVPFRDNDDKVLMIVPKRNIETWLAYLRGKDVDEKTKGSLKEFVGEIS